MDINFEKQSLRQISLAQADARLLEEKREKRFVKRERPEYKHRNLLSWEVEQYQNDDSDHDERKTQCNPRRPFRGRHVRSRVLE